MTPSSLSDELVAPIVGIYALVFVRERATVARTAIGYLTRVLVYASRMQGTQRT